MAMVVVLSVFNGIEGLVESLYGTLDADVVVAPAVGKRFDGATFDFNKLKNNPGVEAYSKVIEDGVLLQFNDKQTVAMLKGVDENFSKVVNLDSAVNEGSRSLLSGTRPKAIVGAGLRYQLEMPHTEDVMRPLQIYALPKGRSIKYDREQAFQQHLINLGGVFSVNADFDTRYVFVPLSFAKECFGYSGELTAIELKLKPGISTEEFKNELAPVLGKNFKLTTREEKNALIFQTSKTEKWITFLILIFIVFIAAFNILASLTMLIIDKKGDLKTLQSMGMDKPGMTNIFFYQSLLINAYGTLAGIILGLGFCYAQIKFGLIRFTGAIVEFYPVEIQWMDMGAIVIVVGIISLLSFFGVKYLINRHSIH